MAASHLIWINLPIRAYSLNDSGGHWAVKARRAKLLRQGAHWELKEYKPTLPAVVTLTRINAPRSRGLDSDNNIGALKPLRDGVADWLGVDDADPRVEWLYAQEKGKAHGVRVVVETVW